MRLITPLMIFFILIFQHINVLADQLKSSSMKGAPKVIVLKKAFDDISNQPFSWTMSELMLSQYQPYRNYEYDYDEICKDGKEGHLDARVKEGADGITITDGIGTRGAFSVIGFSVRSHTDCKNIAFSDIIHLALSVGPYDLSIKSDGSVEVRRSDLSFNLLWATGYIQSYYP